MRASMLQFYSSSGCGRPDSRCCNHADNEVRRGPIWPRHLLLRPTALPPLSDQTGRTRSDVPLSVALGPSNLSPGCYPPCAASARLSGGDARVPLGVNAATAHGPVSSRGLGVSSVSSGCKKGFAEFRPWPGSGLSLFKRESPSQSGHEGRKRQKKAEKGRMKKGSAASAVTPSDGCDRK
jgi:hypothetical protein